MPCPPFNWPIKLASGALARARRLASRWLRNAEGVAAVEFALIAPMMGVMFVGAIELSQALTVDRRAMQISSTTSDLVARANAAITQSDISDIMKVGGYIMLPYNTNPLQITVRNVTSSPTTATNTKQSWSCLYNGTGGTLTCTCSSSTYAIPANLVSTNDSVVVAQVTYNYTPLIFDYFLKKNLTKSGSVYVFSKTNYAKPRSQAAMLQQANGTPCPSPTFP